MQIAYLVQEGGQAGIIILWSSHCFQDRLILVREASPCSRHRWTPEEEVFGPRFAKAAQWAGAIWAGVPRRRECWKSSALSYAITALLQRGREQVCRE